MKRVYILFIILCLSSLLFADGIISYFEGIKTDLYSMLDEMDSQGYELGLDATVFGALIDEGDTVSMNYLLEPGRDYYAFAIGDEDAEDLDIKIYDPEGEELVSDTSINASAGLSFTVSKSGRYRVEVKNYGSDWEDYLYGYEDYFDDEYEPVPVFAVCGLMSKTSRYSDTIDLFKESYNRFLSEGAALAEEYALISPLNSIILGGAMVSEDGTTAITNLQMGDKEIVVIAVGSDNLNDADLKLTRQTASGEVDFAYSANDAEEIASDGSADTTAQITADVSDGNYYALKMRNYSSDGDAFLMYFLYEMDE